MKHLEVLASDQASSEAQEIFDGLQKKYGMVPNVYAVAGNSPVTLGAFLNFGQTLRKGQFDVREIEAIALAVAQANGCEYCLAAHTAAGKMVGFSEDETLALRDSSIVDTKLKALTGLSRDVVKTRGYPSSQSIQAFFSAGYSQAALVELIGFVVLNIFTNYLNHIAETPLDFPAAKNLSEKAAA